MPEYSLIFPRHLGSFSFDVGDGSENVTFKTGIRIFFFYTLPRLSQFAENLKCTEANFP